MDADRLYDFVSHTAGKNAHVAIYRDRIEWERKRGISAGKITAAAFTGGMSLALTGVKNGKAGSEMIPVKSITSVTTKRDGMLNTIVSVITAGNTIDFRVSHEEARQVREILTSLLLGDASAAAVASLTPPAAEAPALPGAAVSPAGDSSSEVLASITKLGELHAAGLLTDEEFAGKKAELLARM